MMSIYRKRANVNEGEQFWARMLRGEFGPQLTTPTVRSATSLLGLYGDAAVPALLHYMTDVLHWFYPAVGGRPRLLPDARLVTSALQALSRHRRHDLAEYWFLVFLQACPTLAQDRFVSVKARALFGDRADELLSCDATQAANRLQRMHINRVV